MPAADRESEAKPWDRLPTEPARWFARLEQFRLLGPERSLLALYNQERQKEGKGRKRKDGDAHCVPAAWNDAVRDWRWEERCKAWDAAEQAKTRTRVEDSLEEMRERQIGACRVGLNRAVKRLAEMDVEEMTPKDVLEYIERFIRLERLVRGVPETVTRQEQTGPDGASVPIAVRVYIPANGRDLPRQGLRANRRRQP